MQVVCGLVATLVNQSISLFVQRTGQKSRRALTIAQSTFRFHSINFSFILCKFVHLLTIFTRRYQKAWPVSLFVTLMYFAKYVRKCTGVSLR